MTNQEKIDSVIETLRRWSAEHRAYSTVTADRYDQMAATLRDVEEYIEKLETENKELRQKLMAELMLVNVDVKEGKDGQLRQ